MAKQQGWQKGQGKFSNEVKITNAPAENPDAKGKNVSRPVYDDNDNPAVRGTRDGFA